MSKIAFTSYRLLPLVVIYSLLYSNALKKAFLIPDSDETLQLTFSMKFTEQISRVSCLGRRRSRRESPPGDVRNSGGLYTESQGSDEPEATRRRKAEALKACGLLDQSRKYGHDIDTHLGHRRSDSSCFESDDRTLFDEYEGLKNTECTSSSTSVQRSPWLSEKKSGIRMRRAGSLIDDIDRVPDAESRRLSEVAYIR